MRLELNKIWLLFTASLLLFTLFTVTLLFCYYCNHYILHYYTNTFFRYYNRPSVNARIVAIIYIIYCYSIILLLL
jgi:hypothetical protein